MKTAVFAKAGQMVIKDVDQPTIQQPDDVIIRVVRACVCGSDLWAYRGLEDKAANSENGGHEAIGIVTAVGDAITTVQPHRTVHPRVWRLSGLCCRVRWGVPIPHG